jgi:hypothetical protein
MDMRENAKYKHLKKTPQKAPVAAPRTIPKILPPVQAPPEAPKKKRPAPAPAELPKSILISNRNTKMLHDKFGEPAVGQHFGEDCGQLVTDARPVVQHSHHKGRADAP